MNDPELYRQRRARFARMIGPDAVALLHSPPETVRNSDVHDPFRQLSDLLYLTGFAEPGATLVLRGGDAPEATLFVRPSDPERETWDGRRAGVAGAKATYGADAAFANTELGKRLPRLLAGASDLYYSVGVDPDFDARVMKLIAGLRRTERRGESPPERIVDPRGTLHEMRLRKDDSELALLREAARITCEAHVEAMKAARPGGTEYEIAALVDYTFRRRGGSGPGYPSIVGSGDNATILHYIDNNGPLVDGDLLLIDAGCEYGFYTADVTRTFPVGGRFSDAQRRCYEVVLEAQKAAIEAARPGATIDALHDQVTEHLTRGMIELGLLDGTVEERIADDSYKRFYMHRTSHWLGLDVHDVGNYQAHGACRPLEPGMVITIEPGLYIAGNAEGVDDAFRGIGIRIEDDVLITPTGNDVLTSGAPKEVAEVEALCAS